MIYNVGQISEKLPKRSIELFLHLRAWGVWWGRCSGSRVPRHLDPMTSANKPQVDNVRTKQLLIASPGCCTLILSIQARNTVCHALLRMAAYQLVQLVQPEKALLSRLPTKNCQLARTTIVKPADPELILKILKKNLTVARAKSKTWHNFSMMQVSH